MLGHRLFSAAIIISAMLVLVWLDFQLGMDSNLGRPGLLLGALCIAMSGMASVELVQMWSQNCRLSKRLAAIAAMTMTTVCCLPLLWRDYPPVCSLGKFGWAISGLIIAVVIVFFFEMYRFERRPQDEHREPGEVTARIAHYSFAFVYLLLLFGFVASHRTVENNSIGMISIITLIATVKMSDAFAYFTGKSLGKHRIAPVLSPKKTLEGAIGSVFGAWFAAAIVIFLVAPYIFDLKIDKPFWWFLLYGLLVTLAGMAGDLAESLLKRDSNCKDSGKWLPGLGGILDVMDSLIFAAPVSYLMWM